MIEENSGPAKSVPLDEVSHLVSVPLSEVLLYLGSIMSSDGTPSAKRLSQGSARQANPYAVYDLG